MVDVWFFSHFFGSLRNNEHTREFACGGDIHMWKTCRGLFKCDGNSHVEGGIYMFEKLMCVKTHKDAKNG